MPQPESGRLTQSLRWNMTAPHGGVVQAAEEGSEVGSDVRDGCQKLPDWDRPSDYAPVYFFGDLRCLPGDFADRIGRQEVQLDCVAQNAVEHGTLERNGCCGPLAGVLL